MTTTWIEDCPEREADYRCYCLAYHLKYPYPKEGKYVIGPSKNRLPGWVGIYFEDGTEEVLL